MKHLPNLITLLNLLSGCLAIVAVANGQLIAASWWVILALFFDLLDGLLARLLDAVSDIGRQLDSLADVVSFGVAPGLIMYNLMADSLDTYYPGNDTLSYFSYAGFLLPLFAALRLARFNIDPGQVRQFIGLPTPASALMVLSVPFALNCITVVIPWLNAFYENPWGLFTITIILSALMVSPLKLFSLKIRSIYWKYNRGRYAFILVSVALFLILRFASIPFILMLYIVLSQFRLNAPEAD